MVVSFSIGDALAKSISHTNLVLVPKKENIKYISDKKSISRSNFMNKILSKIHHDRSERILPRLISRNQSSFVKGRSIVENVLLA